MNAVSPATGIAPRQAYEVQGQSFFNIEANLEGRKRPEEVIVVGAHYDSHGPSPGANDNASGVAALLELAEVLRPRSFSRSLRFVAFTNEEEPFTRSLGMGSRQYARRCRERRDNDLFGNHRVRLV